MLNLRFTSRLSVFAMVFFAAILTGCIQTQATMLNSEARSEVIPDQVQVYRTLDNLTCAYEEVAVVFAQGDVAFTNEAQMIRAAKKRAAKIGANGIVLSQIKEPNGFAQLAGSLIGLSPDRRGELLAIYVPEPCQSLATAQNVESR